jgi:hypothetical protein
LNRSVVGINDLPESLNNDKTRMNDTKKQKQVTGQMNYQTPYTKAKTSVFLFLPTEKFLKIILTSRTNSTFGFA